MSETLTKAQWQEKKRHGSNREKRAAASVQTARMIDKLIERSRDLNNTSNEYPNNALVISNQLAGSKESNRASLATIRDHYNFGRREDNLQISRDEKIVKPRLGKTKTEEVATILKSNQDTLQPASSTYSTLDVDPKGKQKPVIEKGYTYFDGVYNNRGRNSHAASSEEVVSFAAPALYEMKKGIDEAEAKQSRKAA